MVAYLKKAWRLTLCIGLFIYFIRCSATQVKMGMDQQGNTNNLPTESKLMPTANATYISDAFNGINGNSVLIRSTIDQGLYNFYKGFFKKLSAFYWLESNTKKEPQLLIKGIKKDIKLALALLSSLDKTKRLITEDMKNNINFFIEKSDKMLNTSPNTIGDFFYWNYTYTTAMEALNTLNHFNLNNGTMHACTRDCCQSQIADQHPPAAMEPLQSLLGNEKEKKNKSNTTAKSK